MHLDQWIHLHRSSSLKSHPTSPVSYRKQKENYIKHSPYVKYVYNKI